MTSENTAWTQRVASPSAAEIAREAIPLLEAALKERFGIRVKMGAELEFSALLSAPLNRQYGISNDPLALKKPKKTLNDFSPARKKTDKDKPPFFGRSGYISYAYREITEVTENLMRKYELVFTHENEGSLQELADAIVDTKLVLSGKAPIYSPANQILSKGLRRQFLKSCIPHVSFDPTLPYLQCNPFTAESLEDMTDVEENERDILPQTTHGLHVNCSVIDSSDGLKLMDATHSPIGKLTDFNHNLRDGIYDVFHEAMLALDSPASCFRRERNKDYCELEAIELHKHIVNYGTPIVYNIYLENTIPDASSNPHIAIMLSLAGIYAALEGMQYDKEQKDFSKNYDSDGETLPVYWQEQIEAFEKASLLKTVLNNISGNTLGDAFHAAVLREKGRNRDSLQSPLHSSGLSA